MKSGNECNADKGVWNKKNEEEDNGFRKVRYGNKITKPAAKMGNGLGQGKPQGTKVGKTRLEYRPVIKQTTINQTPPLVESRHNWCFSNDKEKTTQSPKRSDPVEQLQIDKEIVNKFAMNQRQPTIEDSKNWTNEMFKYFKEQWETKWMNDCPDEEDVFDDETGISKMAAWNVRGMCNRDMQKDVKKFIRDEKLSICAALETHVKERKINKICDFVYGNWSWVSNMDKSDKGCRIIVGWNEDDVNVNLIHSTKQTMLCLVEIKDSKDLLHMGAEQNPNSGILNKIDRVLGNVEFMSKFPNSHALFLPHLTSDHSPTVLIFPKAMNKKHKALAHKSRIETVNDENKIRYEGAQVAEQFVNHFQNFLGTTSFVQNFDMGSQNSKAVCDEDAVKMIMNVSDKEIKNALFDICDNKAPGPDGYSAKFFKSAWSVIKNEAYDAIIEFFRTGRMLREVNATLITLVPKSKTPHKVSDYRPIACCNTIYKIISKILTNRIKSALCKLVSHCQSAFIPGRQITNNILLTQELLRGYNWKNGARRVALKIDIQKAYDTVNWDFLERVLIMRGLRQGDPISPYIFTLVMEVFTLILQKHISEDVKFKYHWGCKDLQISHPCFADDLLVLCHRDLNSVKVVKRALDMFSSVSGLNPNIGKSTMFFGNVKEQDKQDILSILPFKIGSLPVSYLGVPLITKHLTFTDYKVLIDKVKIKVNDWKNKMLSYAGFLWCQCELSKGKGKVAWKQVCKPKDKGGLRIKNLSLWNEVLMAKHLWNVATMKESLWVKWIHEVRLKGNSIWEIECEKNSSYGWKQILSLRDKLRKHVTIKQAGLELNVKLKDMIKDGLWKWPKEWNSTFRHNLPNFVPKLIEGSKDSYLWETNDGKCNNFSTNRAWKDWRDHERKVDWCDLVWFSNCTPKHSFIVWMAVRDKHTTQLRIMKWYPEKQLKCSLCGMQLDSLNHLFFECNYSNMVWKEMMEKSDYYDMPNIWDVLLITMTNMRNNKSIKSVLRRIAEACKSHCEENLPNSGNLQEMESEP
ncbi:RNA-directed DNA polymerase, eukaryota, reverse transcriptase zinc-binding domain protein [Tanacetum coccineum]